MHYTITFILSWQVHFQIVLNAKKIILKLLIKHSGKIKYRMRHLEKNLHQNQHT